MFANQFLNILYTGFYKLCLSGALLCLFPLLVLAAPPLQQQALDTTKALSQYTMDKWGIDDGLPSNSVMAQLKSKDGYIWLATYDGLARLDGIRFKTYNQRTHPQFPTNSLFDMLEDRSGNLWIATNGGGVLKKSGEEFKLIENNEYLPNKSITSLAEDAAGQVWVGTRGGLALIRDDVYVRSTEIDRLRNKHIFTVYTDAEGSLWIGTVGEGLWQLKNGLLRQYNNLQGLSNPSVRSLYMDSKGRLWIGTEEGLNIMEHGRIRSVPILNKGFTPFINHIIEDANGTIWLATNEGLLRYLHGKFEILYTDPKDGVNELLNLFSDGEGSLWVGTYYAGYLRLRDGKFNNYSKSEGLPHEVSNVILAEQDGVWIGTNGGVALIKNDVQRVYTLDRNTSANRIRDIYRDSKGILWVGTNDGLFQLKGDKFERTLQKGSGLASDKIRRIVEDKTGCLWIGTRNGLFVRRWDKPQEVKVIDELSGIFILSLYLDSKDNLWIATNGKGLYRYDGKNYQQFTTNDGLSSDVLFDIWEDQTGNIWVGSNDGLNVYRNKSWHNINEKQGLFVNTIFQVIPDALDNLWLTTNRGVFLVKRKDLLDVMDQKIPQVGSFRQFTTSSGMRSNEITAVSKSSLAPDGTLWFCTLNGVSAIHPSWLSANQTPPVVKLEKVTGDKLEHSFKDEVRFAAGTRQYEIQYTGFNYYTPKATQFSYMLEGFDDEWQQAGSRRVAYYTNLPAGSYTFRVKAANEDGIESEQEVSLSIVQEAYFWNTWWFRTLLFLIAVVIILMVYYWRTQQLKVKTFELEMLVEERTNHIISQKEAIEKQKEELTRLNHLKDKLLSVLSHDLRQPFSSISGLLALLRERQIDQQEFQHFSKELNQQVKWQVHMLDNVLLWTRNQLKGLEVKPVFIDFHELVNEILVLQRSQATFKNISLRNDVTPETNLYADADIMHLVLRNLVGNALKFTQVGGTISVNASMHNNACRIEVVDNGIGIEEDRLKQLFKTYEYASERGTSNEKGAGLGLSLCKEFVEASGGKIWAQSQQGVGSRFIFEIPQKKSAKTAAERLQPSTAV